MTAESATTDAEPSTDASVAVCAEDILRADLYDFLAAFLARPPSGVLLTQAMSLEGDDSDLGRGIAAVARLAKSIAVPDAQREFNALFIGLGRGELIPHCSYYLTGFLNEKPLARLRGDMSELGIEREQEVYEPEDSMASLCEMMAGLIRGRFGDPSDLAAQKKFFEAHLSPWAGHFFKDLESAETSVLYAPIGTIGRVFMGIEQDAIRMEG